MLFLCFFVTSYSTLCSYKNLINVFDYIYIIDKYVSIRSTIATGKVSIGIIAASLFLCDQIRNNIVTKWSPGLVQNLVLDAILAFELCGPALEFGVIFNHYGIGVWTIGKQYTSNI